MTQPKCNNRAERTGSEPLGVSASPADVFDRTQGDPNTFPRPTRWAWVVCWLMFASTTLNYMDRQALAIVGPQIKGEYHLSNSDFGWVLAAFAMTYSGVLFQVPAGYLVDRWSVRWVYAGAVAWWSLAAIAAAHAPTLGILMALRALLGVGESFNWPCALRVTRTILPPSERSLGNGIFEQLGAAVGAVLTPLIVTPIAAYYGWRRSFLIVGVLGFLWVGLWLTLLGGRRGQVFAGRPSSTRTRPGADFLHRADRHGRGARMGAAIAGSAYWRNFVDLVRHCRVHDRFADRTALDPQASPGRSGLDPEPRGRGAHAAILGHDGRVNLGQYLGIF